MYVCELDRRWRRERIRASWRKTSFASWRDGVLTAKRSGAESVRGLRKSFLDRLGLEAVLLLDFCSAK